ncbi:MAG TPA: DUF4974 domain-containing protein, partial [Pirellulales bacterium]
MLRRPRMTLRVAAALLLGTMSPAWAFQDAPLVFRTAALQPADAAAPGDVIPGDAAPAVAPAPTGMEDGALLGESLQDVRVYEEFLSSEVQRRINDARGLMRDNPQGARDLLKQVQQTVRTASEINAEVRFQLDQQIEAALRAASVIESQNEQDQIDAQARDQEREERERLTRDLFVQEQKLDAIMQRFKSLMDEGNYPQAREVAMMARDVAPGLPTTVGAVESTEMTANTSEILTYREQRAVGYVASLMDVESSAIPFPDNTPIIYPAADVWQRITESRKKYASVDLANEGEAERRIRSALEQPSELDFAQGTPLSEIFEYLSDKHGVDIVVDWDRLDQDEGMSSDAATTADVRLNGISLRSALRILLKQYRLTYVVENEVLYITTQVEAETRLIPKVYPVADLVVQIQSQTGQNMGMSGGNS